MASLSLVSRRRDQVDIMYWAIRAYLLFSISVQRFTHGRSLGQIFIQAFRCLLTNSGKKLFDQGRRSGNWEDWSAFHHWFGERIVWLSWLYFIPCITVLSALPIDIRQIDPAQTKLLLGLWFSLSLLAGITIGIAVAVLNYRWTSLIFFGASIWLGSTLAFVIWGVDWQHLGRPLFLIGMGITLLGVGGWAWLDRWCNIDRWWVSHDNNQSGRQS
jgi:hypothetical protein